MTRPTLSTVISNELPGLNYDQILAICGDLGRYQIILLALFGLQNFLSSIHYFTQTVSSFVPNHWCYHEKLENMSFKEIEKVYRRFDNPSCTKLEHVYDVNNVTKSNERCTRWIYNYDFGFESMNTELNWVCDAAYKSSVGQSFFFVGSVIGTLIFGFLADRLGRLPVLTASNFFAFLGDFLTTYTHQIWPFSICRFIAGLSVDTDVYLLQMIVIEYINPKWRTLGLNLMIGVFFCAGVASSPWIAVMAGKWRLFLCYTSFPLLLALFYFCIIQESAQWLLTRNNIEGAIQRLRVVAKTNRRQVTEQEFEDFRRNFEANKLKESNKKKENLIDLFRGKRIRRITLILLYESIVITLSYETISRNMQGIGFSALIAFSVSALVILPASLVLMCFQNPFGRKGMSAITTLVAGILITIMGIILASMSRHDPIMLFCFVLVGRFCASISFDAGQQFAAELIPTSVRGQGVAVIHVVGFAAAFLVPYIILLGTYYRPAPSLIVGVLYLSGSFLCLFLPETARKSLPNCIENFQTFGKDEGIWSFVCCRKKASTNDF